jgi:glycosyltransferase involved in cell wall biosynthesis
MGGIGRYVHAVADGLRDSTAVRSGIVVVGAQRSTWSLPVVRRVPEWPVPLGGSLALLRVPVHRFDVLHFPMHEAFPVYAALPAPVVMTIHSVEPLFLPAEDVLGARAPLTWRLPYRLLRATRRRLRFVLTPSETTAGEIERHLRIDRSRIRVVPHGVSAVFAPGPARERPVEGPFVLHVSHHQPQKNVVRLLEAVALLDPEVGLVVAGDTGRCDAAYREAIARLGIEARVRFLGPVVDDARLADLYRAAAVFAMPSLQESFGLPVLEAAACGCPVVVGRGTGAAETIGDAGIAVDPRSVEELAEALRTVLDGGAVARELAAAGPRRAAAFTWAASVAAHERAYEEAAA